MFEPKRLFCIAKSLSGFNTVFQNNRFDLANFQNSVPMVFGRTTAGGPLCAAGMGSYLGVALKWGFLQDKSLFSRVFKLSIQFKQEIIWAIKSVKLILNSYLIY